MRIIKDLDHVAGSTGFIYKCNDLEKQTWIIHRYEYVDPDRNNGIIVHSYPAEPMKILQLLPVDDKLWCVDHCETEDGEYELMLVSVFALAHVLIFEVNERYVQNEDGKLKVVTDSGELEAYEGILPVIRSESGLLIPVVKPVLRESELPEGWESIVFVEDEGAYSFYSDIQKKLREAIKK